MSELSFPYLQLVVVSISGVNTPMFDFEHTSTVSYFLFILMLLVGGAETPRAVAGCIDMNIDAVHYVFQLVIP